VALVECVEHEILVPPQFFRAGPDAGDEPLVGRIGERRRAGREADDIRGRLGLSGRMPERGRRVERLAQGRALALESLRQKGIPGGQRADRARRGRVALGEEHRAPPGSGPPSVRKCAGA
jgi:hypothetical protein